MKRNIWIGSLRHPHVAKLSALLGVVGNEKVDTLAGAVTMSQDKLDLTS